MKLKFDVLGKHQPDPFMFEDDGRLHGTLKWHKPLGKQEFPAICTDKFMIENF